MNVSADAGPGTASWPGNLRQEIRLAVVIAGGVGLAIWAVREFSGRNQCGHPGPGEYQ
jgi:hypothetical protein